MSPCSRKAREYGLKLLFFENLSGKVGLYHIFVAIHYPKRHLFHPLHLGRGDVRDDPNGIEMVGRVGDALSVGCSSISISCAVGNLEVAV